ncbi:MAG: MerR family transcriptional regulator [Paludibacteraceae bacterium]|nr:MerR family transcriptional regulator [Paludibacteraceae bacterium]
MEPLIHQREAIELTGLPASTLRYWETQFEQINPRKDNHGNRYYTQEEIALFRRIRYIRDELHITRIAAIRKELANGDKQTDVRQEATDILLRLREQLVSVRNSI